MERDVDKKGYADSAPEEERVELDLSTLTTRESEGASLDNYRFIRLLGRGGQAETWLAADGNGREVAIKIYDMQKMSDWKEEALLRREVETLKLLNQEGVPRYYDFIEAIPKYYLIMEYVAAPSIEDRIRAGQRWTYEEILIIFERLANILAQLHRRYPPIIHRDIKASNILLSDDLKPTLIDFGVVAARDQRTMASTMVGSIGYMAPELLMGRVTPAADIYSLGACMVYMLTGRAPHEIEGDDLDLNYEPYLQSDLPSAFKELLHDCLAANPKERLSSGQSLQQRLYKLKRLPFALSFAVSEEPKARRSPRPRSKTISVLELSQSQKSHRVFRIQKDKREELLSLAQSFLKGSWWLLRNLFYFLFSLISIFLFVFTLTSKDKRLPFSRRKKPLK